jgi:hypothetical protein
MNDLFDYVRYDENAKADQEMFKRICEGLENAINSVLKSPRAKALSID